MGKPAGKAKMRMSAVGSDSSFTAYAIRVSPSSSVSRMQRSRGFTLIELMVVITLIAIATAGVSFAIRDNASTLLDREADRLSVILETARVQSRSSGVALAWLPLAQGFVVLPADQLVGKPLEISAGSINAWLAPGLNAQIVSATTNSPQQGLLLGAEPMIAPASVLLILGTRRLRVGTDGLRPFAVQSVDELGKP